jgi:hypothetical protein
MGKSIKRLVRDELLSYAKILGKETLSVVDLTMCELSGAKSKPRSHRAQPQCRCRPNRRR